jgi:hypothetical protein
MAEASFRGQSPSPVLHRKLHGDLVAAIPRFVDGWNERSQPFLWSKTPTTS